MKILTLNSHSLLDQDYGQKLEWFVAGILKEMPDIVALQEVNQTFHAALVEPEALNGQYPVPGCMNIRSDNHAAQVARMLWQNGIPCYWTWIPIKLGYGRFDEGVAILSLGRKIRCVDAFPITKDNNYQNWRTRAVLGVQVEGLEDWFYTVHMGWWDDEKARFLDQWKTLNCCIMSKRMCGTVWLLGDFNAPDTIHGQGYEHIIASGWIDTYQIAAQKDSGITVPNVIDGWKERSSVHHGNGMRLDYIWCNRKHQIRSSRTMFTGEKEPVVSDHYGVLIEVKE